MANGTYKGKQFGGSYFKKVSPLLSRQGAWPQVGRHGGGAVVENCYAPDPHAPGRERGLGMVWDCKI